MKRLDFPKQNDTDIGYYVFLPENYDKAKKYPMILMLHGAGERGNGRDTLSNAINIGLGHFLDVGEIEVEAIVFCPQCDKGKVWNEFIPAVKDLTLKVGEEYGADFDRLSVTGLSMGGFGTWEFAMQYPSLVSAIAPICGGGMAWRTSSIKDVPVWTFHGNADTVVNICNTQDMVNTARSFGANVEFTILDGVGHDAWTFAYTKTQLVDWLISKKRA
jgi:predicted peptidase